MVSRRSVRIRLIDKLDIFVYVGYPVVCCPVHVLKRVSYKYNYPRPRLFLVFLPLPLLSLSHAPQSIACSTQDFTTLNPRSACPSTAAVESHLLDLKTR